jgi:hypothetical protein
MESIINQAKNYIEEFQAETGVSMCIEPKADQYYSLFLAGVMITQGDSTDILGRVKEICRLYGVNI